MADLFDSTNAYEAKQEARRARYLARAESARKEAGNRSDHAYNLVRDLAQHGGQPILIGHYSEKKHRTHLAAIDNNYRAAQTLDKKAYYYEEKAAAVGGGGISSDDPQAIQKLEMELSICQKRQEMMKAANKIVRLKISEEDKQEKLLALGFPENDLNDILHPKWASVPGFQRYDLAYNNANMKRITQRIEALKKTASREDVEIETSLYTYREDTAENRIMFIFDGKPETAVRDILKRHGFKWSPTRSAWVRMLNNNGIFAARETMKELKQ